MNTIYSPARLDILLHYRGHADKHPHHGHPYFNEQIAEFIEVGLLTAYPQEPWYTLTERGEKFIDMLLDTPFPKQVWIDPRFQFEAEVIREK